MMPGTDHGSPTSRPVRTGFTMIEVLVVMVMIAIMAAVAIPKLGNVGSTRAAVAARMIARDLTYARERAIATGTRVWVVFNAGAQSYSVMSENPSSPGRAGAFVMADPNLSGKNYIQYLNTGEYAGVTMSSVNFDSNLEVGFDWVGKPYNNASNPLAATGTISLSNGFGVTVEVGTGLAKVTP
jgi:type II secretion system protein H